jgi:putative ABC transport system permease protein
MPFEPTRSPRSLGTGKGIGVESRQGGLRSALVVGEVALAIVLTISSGLILRSLFALQNVNIGFDPPKVVFARITWPEGRYDLAFDRVDPMVAPRYE